MNKTKHHLAKTDVQPTCLYKVITGILLLSTAIAALSADKRQRDNIKILFGISLGTSLYDGADETKKYGHVTSESALAFHKFIAQTGGQLENKSHAPGWTSTVLDLMHDREPYRLEIHANRNFKYWKLHYHQLWHVVPGPSYTEFIGSLKNRLGQEDYSGAIFGKYSASVPITSTFIWAEINQKAKEVRLVSRPLGCDKRFEGVLERAQCTFNELSKFDNFWKNAEPGLSGAITKVKISTDLESQLVRSAEIEVYDLESSREFAKALSAVQAIDSAKAAEVDKRRVPKF